MPDYCDIRGATLSLQGQCLKYSLGCDLDDQTESGINAPNCRKVRISHFIRLTILIKGIFCMFLILIWRTVALYTQFKIHEWIEFLTRVKLSKFVGKFLVLFKLYDGPQVIYVERSENRFLQRLTWPRNKRQGLNYHVKIVSQRFLSEMKLPIFIFFSTVLRRIFSVYKHFGFAKVKIHFALYEVRNDASNLKGQSQFRKIHRLPLI